MASRAIDKMHIVHARRAGRHAGEAGQAAVDMLHGQRIGGPVLFEHLLDEIDTSARAIELVAEQHEGRAGRGAKAAMDAGAQNFLGLRRRRILQLRRRKNASACLEFRPHAAAAPECHRDRTASFSRRDKAGERRRLRLEHRNFRPHFAGARIKVAWPPPCCAIASRMSPAAASGARIEREPHQAARPVEQGLGGIRAGNGLGDLRSSRGRHRNFPDDFITRLGERRDVADRAPERLRRRGIEPLRPARKVSAWLRAARSARRRRARNLRAAGR